MKPQTVGSLVKAERNPAFAQMRDAILSPDGDQLLEYMRAMFYNAAKTTCPSPIMDTAREIGWISVSQDRVATLTTLGRRVADSAREFCHWVHDGKPLPPTLTPDAVRGLRILDVGCGAGRYLFSLQQHGAQAIGVDLDPTYLQLSSILAEKAGVGPISVLQAAAERLPFPDGSFDAVLCLRSLAYMEIGAALCELSRVIKRNGRAYLVTGTLSDLVRRAVTPSNWFRGVGRSAALAIEIVNSCSSSCWGSRMIRPRRNNTTDWPVHVSKAYLNTCLDRAGLTLERFVPEDSLFVAVRK